MNLTLDQLNGMTYRELQNLALRSGIKANLKRLDMINQLMAVQASSMPRSTNGVVNQLKDNEKIEVDALDTGLQNETIVIENKSLANSTYIHELGHLQKSDEELFLSDDESILAGNLTQTISSHRSGDKENPVNIENPAGKHKNSKLITPARIGRGDTKRLGVNSSARFADAHKKLFDKMQSIDVYQAKRDAMNHREAANTFFERLSTPKNQQRPGRRRFHTPEAPNEENFKFGDVLPEDIESVQKPLPPPDERPIRPVLRRTNRQPGMDVKELAKLDKRSNKTSNRIEQLATPKSAGPVPISRERRSYTPNKGPYKYIDTTKMSNAEFRAYQTRKKDGNNMFV